MRIDRSVIYIVLVRVLLIGFFGIGLLWRCAHPVAPQGGPRDTLAPKVVSMTPGYGTVNFNEKRILIEFDEYVTIKEQQKEFYISPQMGKTPLLMVRGKGIQIDFRDTLQSNTTYSLNFGASVRDNNEGNTLHNLRYVFSTSSQIDSIIMSGYTVDAYKKDSVSKAFIYFYDALGDTIPQYDSMLMLRKPDAIGRGNENGIFIVENLKPIEYKIYALEDKNNNMQYDPGVDMVAFSDSLYNPSLMPTFRLWHDTTRNYVVADPQIYLRMFMDKPFRRQTLSKSERLNQHRIDLVFGAPNPQIDSLEIEGIDSSQYIMEYRSATKDTLTLWLRVPSQELPDTIKASIKYIKHDSVRVLGPVRENLKLFWKAFESKEERKEREKKEKGDSKERERLAQATGIVADSVLFDNNTVPNPFKYRISSAGEINPEQRIVMDFDLPLEKIDTGRIELVRLGDGDKFFRVRNVNVQRDSMDLRRWTINAPWQEGQKYELFVPDSTFTDMLGYVNDTIISKLSIQTADKFATLSLNVTAKSPESRYIIQILSGTGDKVVRERAHVGDGMQVFKYMPVGTLRVRVVEDVNDNGIWDTGDLVNRRQPERVEIFMQEPGVEDIPTKVGWDIEMDVDMNKLFAPVTMDSLIEQLDMIEQQRLRKLAKDAAAKKKQGAQGRQGEAVGRDSQSGFGGFGGIGGGGSLNSMDMTGGRR